MNNLHILLTEFQNESRALKETESLIKSSLVNKVYIAALYKDGLEKHEQYFDNVVCDRFALKSRNWNKRFFTQLVKYIEFVWAVTKHYKNSDIKLINIHALNLLPLGVFLKWLYKAKLVYDTHELETEKNGLSGFRKRISKLVERCFIKKADAVFVVGENIADWYEREYKITRPTVVMNAPKAYNIKDNNIFREVFDIKDNQTIFLYQGGLSSGRGINIILNAFKKRTDDNAIIVFMGYGELEEQIQDATKKYKTIFFMPAVPPNKVLDYTTSADIGIHMIQNTCLNHYYCMPNKLFEYAMAGLGIVISNMKEMADFVNTNKCGFILDNTRPESLNALIDKILQHNLNDIKLNARLAAINNSWEIQEQKMIDKYKNFL